MLSGGVLSCWEYNWNGQLGNGGTNDLHSPTVVGGISSVVAVACGDGHTCALTASGGVYCWGGNYYGQLGISNGQMDVHSPSFPAATGMIAITAGRQHTCALSSSGGVYCWGYNTDGELGLGSTSSSVLTAPNTPVMTGVVQVTAGYYHTCALTSLGTVTCWGGNDSGQLGNGYCTLTWGRMC